MTTYRKEGRAWFGSASATTLQNARAAELRRWMITADSIHVVLGAHMLLHSYRLNESFMYDVHTGKLSIYPCMPNETTAEFVRTHGRCFPQSHYAFKKTTKGSRKDGGGPCSGGTEHLRPVSGCYEHPAW